jgi:hypothetical protein
MSWRRFTALRVTNVLTETGTVRNQMYTHKVPDGSYRVLFHDKERLCWPDAISAGPDGFMYVTVNKLHRTAPLNAGKDESEPPYYIIRFQPLGAAVVGR